MIDEEKINANRKLILSDINEFGVVFQVIVLIDVNMPSDIILAELKVSHMKLDETMNKWKEMTLKSLRDKK